jgi:hypothetical protein
MACVIGLRASCECLSAHAFTSSKQLKARCPGQQGQRVDECRDQRPLWSALILRGVCDRPPDLEEVLMALLRVPPRLPSFARE